MAKLEADFAIAKKAAARAKGDIVLAPTKNKHSEREGGGTEGRRESGGTKSERESGGTNSERGKGKGKRRHHKQKGKRRHQKGKGKRKRQRERSHPADSISPIGLQRTLHGPRQEPSRSEETS